MTIVAPLGAPAGPTRGPAPSTLFAGVAVVAVVAMGQLQLLVGGGLVVADLLVGVVIGWWMVASPDDPGRRLGRDLAVGLFLILGGSLLATASSGLAPWALRDLILDGGAIVSLLAFLALIGLSPPSYYRWLRGALLVGLVVVLVQLWASRGSALRAAAGFPNPNVAAHFGITVAAAAALISRGRARALALALGAGIWLLTGSFGALLQGGAMAAHRVVVRFGVRAVGAAVVAASGLGALVLVVAVWLGLGTGAGAGLTVAGFSTTRLQRSGAGRFAKWEDGLVVAGQRPWGVGPGSVDALGLSDNELHNEPLAYLVERGPLALIGLVLVGLVLWSRSPAGGGGRTLLLGFGVASIFRETSHYRHIWLCLAIVMAWEATRQRWTGTDGPVPDRVGEGRRGGLAGSPISTVGVGR